MTLTEIGVTAVEGEATVYNITLPQISDLYTTHSAATSRVTHVLLVHTISALILLLLPLL